MTYWKIDVKSTSTCIGCLTDTKLIIYCLNDNTPSKVTLPTSIGFIKAGLTFVETISEDTYNKAVKLYEEYQNTRDKLETCHKKFANTVNGYMAFGEALSLMKQGKTVKTADACIYYKIKQKVIKAYNSETNKEVPSDIINSYILNENWIEYKI